MKDKDYFVLTTNVDHQFQKAGFDKTRLFYTQGIMVCGKPMTMNLRSDHTFVQDEGWERADERYQLFIQRHRQLNVMFLELGTGLNTPGIIKYPFWKMVQEWSKAIYNVISKMR